METLVTMIDSLQSTELVLQTRERVGILSIINEKEEEKDIMTISDTDVRE